MQSVIYILAICSIGVFLFGAVHKHEQDRGYAILIKLAIVGTGFSAILQPLLSLMSAR